MKTVKLFIVGTAIALSMCLATSVYAQNPTTSKKYTVAQVDDLFKQYLTERKHDIMPPTNTSFAKDFPTAKDVEWEESAALYRVEFEIDKMDYKAYYDKQGQLVFFKKEIYVQNLPSVVKNAVVAKYADYKIDDIDVYNKANVLTYEVKVEKGDLEYELLLDDAGTILSEKMD